jgi:phospholipid/cholesterol/gamma-HCH transport system ATP-binding protein
MIEVKNLFKSYGDKGVLSDINISVVQGQSVAIVGKSGAGKSVLLKCLIGLVKPDEGTIYVDNKLINTMSFRQLQEIRSNIGMVFQFGALFDSMTVGENISLALHKLTKLSDDEIKERVFNSLEEVDMVDTEDLMPSELSGGMKKRVGIARAIAIKPTYLFFIPPDNSDGIRSSVSTISTSSKELNTRSLISSSESLVSLCNAKLIFSPTVMESNSAPN